MIASVMAALVINGHSTMTTLTSHEDEAVQRQLELLAQEMRKGSNVARQTSREDQVN